MRLILMYLITLGIFLAIDMVWLNLVARDFYRRHLGHLLARDFNILAALVFYALFVAGLLFFVISPALAAGSLWQALWAGAFFGLVTYATYDLTNMATVRDWPLVVTLVDLAWGSALGAATSFLGALLIRLLL